MGSARAREAEMENIKGYIGQRYEWSVRYLLPHAGRYLNPVGEAASERRGASAWRVGRPPRGYLNVACTGRSGGSVQATDHFACAVGGLTRAIIKGC